MLQYTHVFSFVNLKMFDKPTRATFFVHWYYVVFNSSHRRISRRWRPDPVIQEKKVPARQERRMNAHAKVLHPYTAGTPPASAGPSKSAVSRKYSINCDVFKHHLTPNPSDFTNTQKLNF